VCACIVLVSRSVPQRFSLRGGSRARRFSAVVPQVFSHLLYIYHLHSHAFTIDVAQVDREAGRQGWKGRGREGIGGRVRARTPETFGWSNLLLRCRTGCRHVRAPGFPPCPRYRVPAHALGHWCRVRGGPLTCPNAGHGLPDDAATTRCAPFTSSMRLFSISECWKCARLGDSATFRPLIPRNGTR
jgi:hypothetical protein